MTAGRLMDAAHLLSFTDTVRASRRAATKLHFLHATAFGGFEQAGPQFFTEDGTLVGEYTIHFEDKSFEVMPLVYGEDVRDWWNWDKDKETRRAKVAWRGSNNIADRFEVKLRLFLSTWKNPKPDAPISHIEYRSTKMSAAAPFCLAITGETK